MLFFIDEDSLAHMQGTMLLWPPYQLAEGYSHTVSEADRLSDVIII